MPTAILNSTESHINMPTAMAAFHSNTHSQVQCDKILYRTTNLNVHYYPAFDRNTHSHANSCTALYINTCFHTRFILLCTETQLHVTTAYCTLQIHTHMQTDILHSGETHIHMLSTILHSTDTHSHFPIATTALYRNTHSHAHLCPCLYRKPHSHSKCILHSTETHIHMDTVLLHSTETQALALYV